jgi:hypothetical protein
VRPYLHIHDQTAGVARGHWWEIGRAPAAIYGTIISASVLAAADDEDSVVQVALGVVITLVVYWLAERWSEMIAGNVRGQKFTWPYVRQVFVHGWPMVQASYGPVIVLVLSALVGLTSEQAIDLALSATIVVLAGLGAVAAQNAGMNRWATVGSAFFTALLGVVLILLKALLH